MASTAPPIEGRTWINSPPLGPDLLMDRVAVVVFWSAGCEASLRRLQQVQGIIVDRDRGRESDVVAVAVHTPRMAADDDEQLLRHTVRRHRIALPVVNDPQYLTWSRYNPPGWPSTAVVDRAGSVTGIVAGCDQADLVEAAVDEALGRSSRRRRRDEDRRPALPDEFQPGPLLAELRRHRVDRIGTGGLLLSYPEGLAVGGNDGHLSLIAVADTGNDRIIIGRLDRRAQRFDVSHRLTGLNQPTCLAFVDDHTLAVIERGTNTVSTVEITAGGRQVISDQILRPVGLTVDTDRSLVISDAGREQLIRATANSDGSGYLIMPIAGSGQTGVADGPADRAELAQPVALAASRAGLVFCDAASSNIRLLTNAGKVVNVTDGDLFDWGLVDGLAHRARLQRPSGVCALGDGSIIVADSGNNRLRRLHHRRLETLGLGGLSWPTAVGPVGVDQVVVTDTNNHRLVLVDPNRHQAWPIAVEGLRADVDAESTTGAPQIQVSSGKATAAT